MTSSRARAKAVPFLTFDADPYLAIVDGRAGVDLDAYTTTDQYPYSPDGERAGGDRRRC